MKNDPIGRSFPFRASDLFYLMLQNFVRPDPIQKIAESIIVRSDGESIRVQGMPRVVTRSDIFTVVMPNRVCPSGAT